MDVPPPARAGSRLGKLIQKSILRAGCLISLNVASPLPRTAAGALMQLKNMQDELNQVHAQWGYPEKL